MRSALSVTVLLLTCLGTQSGESSSPKPDEPTGGLAEIALKASELGPQAWRHVQLLLDSSAKPSTYISDPPAWPWPLKRNPDDPAEPFRSEMAGLGAEAVIYLMYNQGSYFLEILRFPHPLESEERWSQRRHNLGESRPVRISGVEFLHTKPGQLLNAQRKAMQETLECRSGRYWIRVAPAGPLQDSKGLEFAFKQLEKIKSREPAAGGNTE
jgi:hypothetical protein